MTAQEADGGQKIHVEHSYKGRTAADTVVVKSGAADASEHKLLAGARAWLALGREFHKASDAEAASHCARAGIAELGDDYADPRTTIDDTGLKILAGEDRIKKGHASDGASVLLHMLELRTQMYVKLHADQILK